MGLSREFAMMARYNRIANERLYNACAQLPDGEYRRQRRGSFGSIHALLNHILLGDRVWMSRFEGGGATTPPLSTILCDDFAPLRVARTEEDARIERFFATPPADFFSRELRYANSKGAACVEQAPVAAAHVFNHAAEPSRVRAGGGRQWHDGQLLTARLPHARL